MIRCLAIDDEPLALDIIESYIRKVPYLQLVRKCSSPLEAIPVLNAERIDLLFIDIQMPEINGIEFLKTIRTDSMVIFTTAHSGYALESYDLNCVDYLLKPISFERFLKAVNKAYEKFGKPLREPAPGPAEGKARTGYLFLKDGHKLVKVLVKDITYIEGLKDYVIVHTAGKRITILQSMKSI
jgi:two-component system, LytTR family, response regulator